MEHTRLRNLLLIFFCTTLVLALSACGSSGDSGQGGGGQESQDQGGNQQAQSSGEQETSERPEAPEDTTLTVTVPEMQNVNNAEVPNVPYTQEAIDSGVAEQALRNHAAIHVDSTGYPWEEEANVYLAGHALGYQGTPSWHAFRDLGQLQEGDKVLVEDANGTEYTYEVFRESFVVDPTDVDVIQPEEGRNILSLQSCTLPDYERRVIVQAELTETTPA